MLRDFGRIVAQILRTYYNQYNIEFQKWKEKNMAKHNITIDDIARDLGISKTTVSRAISGKGRISGATRDRVREYIKACNYRPSASAKGLAESRTYNLALVLPKSFIQLDLPYIRQIMNAICEEAFNWEYNILMCLSTVLYPESLLRTLDNRKVDGVILSRTVENDALVDMLIERDIPFATIGSLPPAMRGKATVEADHDQVGGCRAFCKTVLQGNQEKIAVLGNDMRYIVNQSRLSGFRQAVADTRYPEGNVQMHTDIKNYRACASVVEELLRQGVRRFLAMDDDICVDILRTMEQSAWVTPGDVQIYSLADNESFNTYRYPVSALRFDAAELGQIACRELLRCLREETYEPQPILGYRIIHR